MRRLRGTMKRTGRVLRPAVDAAEEIARIAWSYRYEVLAAIVTEILWAMVRGLIAWAFTSRREPGRVIPFPRPA